MYIGIQKGYTFSVMLTTPHILTGMALVARLPFPWGLPAAFVSHFALDFLVPHWNPHLYTEMKTQGGLSSRSIQVIMADGGAALLLILLVGRQALQSSLWLGALAAILPDLMEIPYYFFHFKHPLLVKFVTFEHFHQAKAKAFWGIITQLVVCGISLSLLL